MFEQVSNIDGVIIKKLVNNSDVRGRLVETFRIDELPEGITPAMSYINFTNPGFWRGPHEHKIRIEIFAFPGPGTIRTTLWDNKKESKTYRKKMVLITGERDPALIIIFPGIVHVIENVSNDQQALLINYPTTLFKGWGRKEEFTDEIRYENDGSEFWKDFLFGKGKHEY
jgi:dTDP-4-dehydrorhamnose 3,5-epimerase